MSGTFVIDHSDKDKYRFNLRADNNQVVLTSQAYESKAAAESGIESVRKNVTEDHHFARRTAKDGSPYFVLTAGNGLTIGQSEMYSSVAAMEKGIESVRVNAPNAKVTESDS